jgi:exopolysaccharide biosynthesis polyprenyl glycosylphosphotransferase
MTVKVPKYKWLLAAFDYLLLFCAFIAAVCLRFETVTLAELFHSPEFLPQVALVAAYIPLWLAAFQHFNLYKINVFLTFTDQLFLLAKSLLAGLLGLVLIAFFIKGMNFVESRLTLGYFMVFGFALTALFRIVLFRSLFVLFAKKKIYQRNVLIVGTDRTAKTVAAQLTLDESHGFNIVGFVGDRGAPAKQRIFEDYFLLGGPDSLEVIVEDNDVDEIIIALSEIEHERLFQIIDQAKKTKALVRLVSELFNIVPKKVLVEKYVGFPILGLNQPSDNYFFLVYKRLFDVVFAAAGLVALAVPFAVIAVLIKLTSKGPVFFIQERIGKDGLPFSLYKFRTMYLDADDSVHREFVRRFIRNSGDDEAGEIKKIERDPRVTRIGRVLRKSSADELPQLFNVLLGDMTLVGPRPCMQYEWNEYETWHRRRLSVKPGCTGIWQVAGRSAVDFNDMVILDLFYIDNMSPLLDVKLIFKTIPVMLFGKGGF